MATKACAIQQTFYNFSHIIWKTFQYYFMLSKSYNSMVICNFFQSTGFCFLYFWVFCILLFVFLVSSVLYSSWSSASIFEQSLSDIMLPIHCRDMTPPSPSLVLWAIICFCMWAFCLKPLLHIGHVKGLSPEWTLQCCVKLCFVANCFEQAGHGRLFCGESPSSISGIHLLLSPVFFSTFMSTFGPGQACRIFWLWIFIFVFKMRLCF